MLSVHELPDDRAQPGDGVEGEKKPDGLRLAPGRGMVTYDPQPQFPHRLS